MEILKIITATIYFLFAVILMIYGLNCYVMIYLFKRGQKNAKLYHKEIKNFSDEIFKSEIDIPNVTTQIAIYNEYNVAERIIQAVVNMEYPKNKHEIQVLDDSNDDTRKIVDDIVNKFKNCGYDIKVVRRDDRTGYKAGALANGLKIAKGEFIAIFDSDFVPTSDFLKLTIPYFLKNSDAGLVQARWGHLNDKSSLITKSQSIGIDGHFMVEQGGRSWNGLFMNFNGTAGVWRKKAIYDAGGWNWDTLTEDMDLSYRLQLFGWKAYYTSELVVPAEIPEDINAFKSQQFRWAKGSIQTAIKLLPQIAVSKEKLFKKIEAFFHMTHYLVHPLMLTMALLALPVIFYIKLTLSKTIFSSLFIILLISMSAPSALYIISQKYAYKDWKVRILMIPVLVCIGTGIAVNNTRAVIEAILGIDSPFIRTPKKGNTEIKIYKPAVPVTGFIEISIGFYCLYSLIQYLEFKKYLIGPFLAIYSLGYLYIGFMTIIHSISINRRGV